MPSPVQEAEDIVFANGPWASAIRAVSHGCRWKHRSRLSLVPKASRPRRGARRLPILDGGPMCRECAPLCILQLHDGWRGAMPLDEELDTIAITLR